MSSGLQGQFSLPKTSEAHLGEDNNNEEVPLDEVGQGEGYSSDFERGDNSNSAAAGSNKPNPDLDAVYNIEVQVRSILDIIAVNETALRDARVNLETISNLDDEEEVVDDSRKTLAEDINKEIEQLTSTIEGLKLKVQGLQSKELVTLDKVLEESNSDSEEIPSGAPELERQGSVVIDKEADATGWSTVDLSATEVNMWSHEKSFSPIFPFSYTANSRAAHSEPSTIIGKSFELDQVD